MEMSKVKVVGYSKEMQSTCGVRDKYPTLPQSIHKEVEDACRRFWNNPSRINSTNNPYYNDDKRRLFN